MPSTDAKFTAPAASAGYFYQARMALALTLQTAYTASTVDVAVERLDDVSFEADGEAIELLQTKHHLRRAADLGDLSPDLWTTLRIWSELALADPNLPIRTRLVLLTTSKAKEGQAASLLRPDPMTGQKRDTAAKEAERALTAAAQTSSNHSLKPAFDAYLALSSRMRASLLSSVHILDEQPLLSDLGPVIEDRLRMAAPRGKAAEARQMLEGWWWPRLFHALSTTPTGSISVLEVENRIDEIRETLNRNALIADFEDATPPDQELAAYEDFGFVRQLRAIGIGSNRIETAKRDFYRAFSQRSRWTRENVVLDGEISRFESTLIEEWEPHFHAMCEKHADTEPDAPSLRQAGADILNWIETQARFPFRNLVKRFLNVGSFHMLSDTFRVGWHRDYRNLGKED